MASSKTQEQAGSGPCPHGPAPRCVGSGPGTSRASRPGHGRGSSSGGSSGSGAEALAEAGWRGAARRAGSPARRCARGADVRPEPLGDVAVGGDERLVAAGDLASGQRRSTSTRGLSRRPRRGSVLNVLTCSAMPRRAAILDASPCQRCGETYRPGCTAPPRVRRWSRKASRAASGIRGWRRRPVANVGPNPGPPRPCVRHQVPLVGDLG